jgi:hypothetical protein
VREFKGGITASLNQNGGTIRISATDFRPCSTDRVGRKPPANTGLLNGQLAWRQHDGSHEDRSNVKYFIEWAGKQLGHAPPVAAQAK